MKTIYYVFPDGKHKALTMSYDDGRLADRKLVDIFNRYNIKGTFHLNAGFLQRKDFVPAGEIATLYKGHEIAAHTYTHPTIARCPLPQVAQQLLQDRKSLEDLVGYPVRGLSYPNGSYTQEIIDLLPSMGIEYSRIVGNSHNFSLPEEYYRWESTCHHNDSLLEHAETFLRLDHKQHLYLFYVWGHSYEFDQDDNWELIEKFCQMTGEREDIWYVTNIEFYDYMSALERLQFSVDASFVYNPSARDLWISVEGETIKVPGGKQVLL